MGFKLVTGFIGLSKLVTTRNYSVIANSHTLQFIIAPINYSVCCVFTGCGLVTAPNVVDFSVSVFHASGPRWLAPGPSYIASVRAAQKTSLLAVALLRCDFTENTTSRSCFIVAWRQCCHGDAFTMPVSSLASAFSKYVTIYMGIILQRIWN
jgi:hypothetical protein